MRLIDADELVKKWTIASPEPYNTDAVEVLDSIREAPTVTEKTYTHFAPKQTSCFCHLIRTQGHSFVALARERMTGMAKQSAYLQRRDAHE